MYFIIRVLYKFSRSFWKMFIALIVVIGVLSCDAVAHAATTTTTASNKTTTKAARITSVGTNQTSFIPHRFTSNNNITILHEVHANTESDEEPTIVLNTHEVLPINTATVTTKNYPQLKHIPHITSYAPSEPLRAYELHPVTFDFNLGDLEDLEDHDSIKKGDLNSEERHLLRNENDDGLTYTERTKLDVDIERLLQSSNTTVATDSTMIAKSTLNLTTQLPITTSGTYILKILKNKSLKKGRELLHTDEMVPPKSGNLANNFNSISRYMNGNVAGTTGSNTNSSIAGIYGLDANYFQILTNLYDHFYWQPSLIRGNVRTGCGLELQAYLTALHANFEWAQRAYDVSGRYRGQIFFGNDKWLGQLNFCSELNHRATPGERTHFEFEFFVADVALNIRLPKKLLVLSIGECLPRSCSAQDVQNILALDPHAHMLTNGLEIKLANTTRHNTTSPQTSLIALQILRVRNVPGAFSLWHELKFQIFMSFFLTLLLVVVAASLYHVKLKGRNLTTPPIAAISARLDGTGNSQATVDDVNLDRDVYYSKPFELFQMRTLNDNNICTIETDVNGNKNTNANVTMPTTTTSRDNYATDAEKSECKVETVSCAGATGTYEAKQHLGIHEQIFLCFSFQSNVRTLLSVDRTKESHTSCLHGLRVFSLIWTIMVHTYLQMFAVGENKFQRIIVERSILYQIIGNATFSVDTFFFISGLLVTLLYLKQEGKKSTEPNNFIQRSCVDSFLMVVYRYIRLTPVYLFTILFNDFAVRHGLDSSVFQPAKIEYNTCRQFWWRNILYINNFYPMSESCMIWSWYMANDMQFFIMAALLLAFSRRYFKIVVMILFTFLLSSWAVSGLVSLHKHYTHKVSQPFESFDYLYDKPWQRVGGYIIGMFVGYVLYKVKNYPKVSTRTNMLLWSVSLALILLVVFGAWNGGELSLVNTAFYVGVGHSAFVCGLVWIVLSCCWGLAPTTNRVLSCRLLWPLSRLTYCAYLVHPTIMFILTSTLKGTTHLSNTFILTMFLGNAVISFGVAFFISVVFEAPVIRLLKIGFKK